MRRRPQADEESNGSEQSNARDEELTRAKRQPPQGVSSDELTDVALLKIDSPRKFPVLALGSTRSVQVADWVVVIGNP